ncbi:glycosyltransferase family 4 protein [Niabella beijingensis]|uniref:glycosyltransferase family 4 protein n=1 Tax=Niabella beijingensis TaxID=2872700 RepID=UPI001CBD3404|nr:glycosyltransferase family 4 protein [Niabella beijingensis]MBZ4190003.1 glycosyltransferase family 4 protein [Niabella beijingensis]
MENNKKKRRVLHILYGGLGGHASVFFSIVKSDVSSEFQSIALFYGVEEVRSDYLKRCDLMNIPYKVHQKKKGIDLRYYFSVFHSLVKLKPDVIFLHSASLILPVTLYRLIHKRTIIITRDTQAHHLKRKSEWLFFRMALRVTDHFVFLTKDSLDGAKAYFKKADRLFKKATIIPNGVDTDIYAPHKQEIHLRSITIGMQSRLQKIKDHPTLLRAFALVKTKIPEKDFKLRIAGDGSTLEELQNLAKALGIGSDVEFCGMLNEEALVKFMDSLDIYVHATHGETMSNSIMQALACGLPTVGADVWGVNNMIHPYVTGLLFPREDATALSQKIIELVLNNTLRVQLSTEARNYAIAHYSLNRLFNDYRPLFGSNKKQ